MADQSRSDLCIIGAGALGTALAEYARTLGASVTLVDRGQPEPGGGPQQALLLAAIEASASRAHMIRHAAEFGLAGGEPKVRMKAVQERAQALADEQAVMTARDRLTGLGIEYVRAAVRFADAHTIVVGDLRVRAKAYILALGAEPLIPAIPGLGQVDYFTPDSILDNARKLTHLLVIGGDADAVSLAQSFARLGSEVTLVPQGPLLPGFDPEAASILLRALSGEGVRILEGAAVREIMPRSQGTGAAVLLPLGDEQALDVSHILVATGRQADLAPLDPGKARLTPVPGMPEQFFTGPLGQTSNRRIRLAGVAAGLDQWPHAIRHGRAVVEQLVLGAPVENLAAQPRLVLTEPALAQVGRVPQRADRLGQGHIVRANLIENDQARALGMAGGLVKVVLAPSGRIAGASAVGPGATEMVSVLALAMEKGIALEALRHLSVPHPSLLTSIVALGEAAAAHQPVSPQAMRWRAMLRAIAFWRR